MNESKKEAIRNFKERKTLRGIYAVRCALTGGVWVGSSRNLAAEKNSAWFSLRGGSHVDKGLQREWNAQGEQSFSYEVLETLEEDIHPLELLDALKLKRKWWMENLHASGI